MRDLTRERREKKKRKKGKKKKNIRYTWYTSISKSVCIVPNAKFCWPLRDLMLGYF